MTILKLSDAFPEGVEGYVGVTVRISGIDSCRNQMSFDA